jgi:RNA polymerase sigma-70 factor (ECF subfamily)
MSGSRLVRPQQPCERADLSAEQIDCVYRAELPRLTRYFSRHAPPGEEAHDLAQDAFIALAQVRPAGPVRNPAALLQRIARNLVSNRVRHTRRWSGIISCVPLAEDIASVPPQQGLWIEAEDLMEQYRRALAALPEKTRTVFLMHRVEDLTYGEIAVRLGISAKTVEYHIAAALKHLDKSLERE